MGPSRRDSLPFEPLDDRPEVLGVYANWTEAECRSAAFSLVLATARIREEGPERTLEVPVPGQHLAFAHFAFRGLPGYLHVQAPRGPEGRARATWRVRGEAQIAQFLCDLGIWPEMPTCPSSTGRLAWNIDRRFSPILDPSPRGGEASLRDEGVEV